jgi:hypothetical protein
MTALMTLMNATLGPNRAHWAAAGAPDACAALGRWWRLAVAHTF